MFDFIVIGAGMMGSAAAKYLAQSGASVGIVGQAEPSNYAAHNGVFASHYDEGRLTHRLSKDLTWSRLCVRSIEQYGRIENDSGIGFHGPVGWLSVARNLDSYRQTAHRADVQREFNVRIREFADAAAIHAAHPIFDFPASSVGLFEFPPAGWINPRELVRAQLAIAQKHGATLIRDVAVRSRREGKGVVVTTRGGENVAARALLTSSGSFTNSFDVLARKLALTVKTETIILAEVDDDEAARLNDMPVVSYDIESDKINGIYMTPPMRYPDGKKYIKLGCDTATDEWPADLDAMQRWMQRGRDDGMGAVMLAALKSFMPDLRVRECLQRPCLVTYTTHRKPYIDQLDEVAFVATGGNGSSAACSDAEGWLAAEMMLGRAWPTEFSRAEFAAAFA